MRWDDNGREGGKLSVPWTKMSSHRLMAMQVMRSGPRLWGWSCAVSLLLSLLSRLPSRSDDDS